MENVACASQQIHFVLSCQNCSSTSARPRSTIQKSAIPKRPRCPPRPPRWRSLFLAIWLFLLFAGAARCSAIRALSGTSPPARRCSPPAGPPRRPLQLHLRRPALGRRPMAGRVRHGGRARRGRLGRPAAGDRHPAGRRLRLDRRAAARGGLHGCRPACCWRWSCWSGRRSFTSARWC